MNASILHTTERIAELLYEHDCLIVPGLGGFVSSRQPAMIDKKRGLLFPPRKEIVLNRSLCHNDGVLVGYIAEVYGVSINEANEMVVAYVDEIKRQLKQKGSVTLEGVGVLRMFGSEMSFVADSEVNYLIDSYGLSAQPISVKPSAAVVRMKRNGQMKRVAASVAILVSLMMFGPETKDASVEKDYSLASIAAEALNKPVVSMVVEAPVESVKEDASANGEANTGAESAAVESINSEAEKVVSVEAKEPEETFYIIVGSFRTEREADVYISSMATRGVSGLEKLSSKGRCRVSAGNFTTHAEAVRNNKSFRNIKGFEKAWVLREKK